MSIKKRVALFFRRGRWSCDYDSKWDYVFCVYVKQWRGKMYVLKTATGRGKDYPHLTGSTNSPQEDSQ